MNRHNSIVDVGEVDEEMARCRFCESDEESSYHIIAECDHFGLLRRSLFDSDRLSTFDFADLKPTKIIRFLLDTGIDTFTDIISYSIEPRL